MALYFVKMTHGPYALSSKFREISFNMRRLRERSPSEPAALNSALKLAKDYFIDSEERYSALLLLLGIILAVASLVALNAVFAWWIVGFWTAITEMSYPLYIQSIQYFFVIVTGFIGASVFKDYLGDLLSLRWRKWLTKYLVDEYTSPEGNNYLEFSRHYKQIDNPAQRIQEDIKFFVSRSIWLSADLLNSILTQITFIGTLWVVGGSLSFAVMGVAITIPGYLVWVAISFALTSSIVSHLIGGSLAELTKQKTISETDFRKEMEEINNDAESIAQDQGMGYYKKSLADKFQAIYSNTLTTIRVRINLTAFNSFYQQFSGIFPYIVAAPMYFAGRTSLGQLMQIGLSFENIQSALSWYINSYELLATYKASVIRIIELKHKMEPGGLETAPRLITHGEASTNELSVNDLSITTPSSTENMIRLLNIKFEPGVSTLIQGVSGLGKSTLFKVIAGTWSYGEGDVLVSKGKKMCFLPQKPSLPNTTLKGVLAYPDSLDTYTDDDYERVLRLVGDLDMLIKELPSEENKFWSRRLSPGQQQRISFARALLKKPDWLFLDEATAALDPVTEARMYSLVKELPDTTIISIAHRPTVRGFHDRIITFKVGEDRRVQVVEDDPSRIRSIAL
jgi:putative ATP-binding cassette transporter